MFSPDKRAKDGLQGRCKACANAANKQRKANDPEKYRRQARIAYAANPSVYAASGKKYRESHAHAIAAKKKAEYERVKNDPEFKAKRIAYANGRKAAKREYDREYRAKNKDKLDALKKIWRAENVDLIKSVRQAYKSRRRAQEAAGDDTRTIHAWRMAALKICKWCNKDCGDKYHVDHIIPLARGGLHRVSNLAISCPSCNLAKNVKMPDEFQRLRAAST